MKLAGLKVVTICPWAIREGVLLRHIEDGPAWWSEVTRDVEGIGSAGASAAGPVPLRIAAPAR